MTDNAHHPKLAFRPMNPDAQNTGTQDADLPLVINPDDYLETEFGREFTPERNRQAWQLAYARLRRVLSEASEGAHVYVVMGVQGAGKSRWVSENLERLGRGAIVFDAALPARRHREELLSIVREYAIPAIGILVSAPLALALSRNAQRNADKRVPEEALKSVFRMLEPPSEDEGFVWVKTIEQQAPLPTTLQTARMTLVVPDVVLAEKLADALNASYALHCQFLVWSKPHWTLEDTQESLQRATKDFDEPAGEKRYFLLSRDDPQALVGCIGLLPLVDEVYSYEVGYWGNQAHAGLGLMREALAALVSQLTGHTLRLTTSSANLSSQRLAEAAGFEWVETLQGARRCEYFGVRDTLIYRRASRDTNTLS